MTTPDDSADHSTPDHETLDDDKAALFPASGSDLVALHARLASWAETAGVLDVAYRTIESPIGDLLLAATETGLVRIAFSREGFDDVLRRLAERISPRILRSPARLDAAAAQLTEYFAGRRHTFDLPLDRRLSTGFRQQVHLYLPRIGYGHTLSYRQLAELVGNPKAVRAVGTACATNPLPIVVPCHRVTRSDGSTGGYAGGPDAKTTLLALERAA